MASTDYPFSITSKFVGAGSAEHMVTIRGQNIEMFNQRLVEAATLFPYAGFIENANTHPVAPLSPVATGPIEPPAPTGDLDHDAQARATVHRINEKANAPKCADHNSPMRPSKDGGWFCPRKVEGGTYCLVHIAA